MSNNGGSEDDSEEITAEVAEVAEGVFAVRLESGRIELIHEEIDEEDDALIDAVEHALYLRSDVDEGWNPPLPPSDATIWRYLDFTQLLSILERGQIWFTNVNQFDDPYEGTLPQMNLQSEVDEIVESTDIERDSAISIHRDVLRPDSPAAMRGYVNCWNVSEHQSAALWEQYVDSPDGVAIRASVDNLREGLSAVDRDLVLGNVVIHRLRKRLNRSGGSSDYIPQTQELRT